MNVCIRGLKEDYKKRGVRLIAGTRMQWTPVQLIPELLKTTEEENEEKEERKKTSMGEVRTEMKKFLDQF